MRRSPTVLTHPRLFLTVCLAIALEGSAHGGPSRTDRHGYPAARQLLQALAGGGRGAPLTKAAAAAL